MQEMLLKLIVLAPFASVAVLYLLRHRLPTAASGAIGCLAVLIPFVAALTLFPSVPKDGVIAAELFRWLPGKDIDVALAFRLDALSYTWTLIITGVGFLIHLYSLGYMKGDPGFTRFFTYLNLFIGSMLVLVLGDSLPLLFLGWEGVGLCSYLLIGFWFDDMANSKAGQKAFIVNRIGDLGFLLAIMVTFWKFHTLDIHNIVERVHAMHADGTMLVGDPHITLIALLFFVGAVGKSAQLPLYVWLPDAMAGPTPVSALIHAATMVTAGIYLVARLSVLFAMSPAASTVVAVIGALTALFTATIALRQRDIKKVLAFSTCSQLGYMFLGLGVGAYVGAVFHVITHAFFKGLLFLGAGSVIHALSGEQDGMKMGGLKRHLPKTHWTFFFGCFALAGIFPFAGFFSKDKILGESLMEGGLPLWLGIIGLIAAFMTAFYTFRLYRLIFTGPDRLDEHAKAHLHESPWTMTVPLMVLAILSLVGGALSMPHFVHFDPLGNYLSVIFQPAVEIRGAAPIGTMQVEVALLTVSLVLAIGGALWAWNRYANGPGKEIERADRGLPLLLENKWFVDEVYAITVVGPMRLVSHISAFVDRYVIDAIVNGIARFCDYFGSCIRMMQTGALHVYALLIVVGAVFLVLSLL